MKRNRSTINILFNFSVAYLMPIFSFQNVGTWYPLLLTLSWVPGSILPTILVFIFRVMGNSLLTLSVLLHIHTYKQTYIDTYIHTYIHIYIHTYIHIYTHTYIHIYKKNFYDVEYTYVYLDT